MEEKFNIYSQLKDELADFFEKKIRIGGTSNTKKLGYEFSQAETLNLIQYVGGSKFLKGDKDDDRVYLNSSVFRADVASKQIDIDVANIRFIPDDWNDKNICMLKRKEFKSWAKDEGFGIELNDMVEKYPYWGHLVAKKVKDDYELIDITKIRNQQDAKSLNEATYTIIEHEMEAWEAQTMPDWDLSGLEYKWNDTFTVYERYGRVPKNWLDEKKGKTKTAKETDSVDTVSYIVLDKKSKKKDGALLFIEEIKKGPFKEVKWKEVKGRWLGVGEIENNFENQKARNAVFNLRLRSMLWSSKNLFQSTDETTAKNLIREVRDGDVITVTDQGITPINTQTKSIADFNTLDDVIEKNSDQKSFTYEVATGESLPGGTPFRLGVILANSTNNHFGLKREKLALFIKEILYEFVIPSFKKEFKEEHKTFIASGEEGFNKLFEVRDKIKEAEFVKQYVITNYKVPTRREIEEYKKTLPEDIDIKVEAGEYDNIRDAIDIEITGESVDVEGKMTTLTTLYQILSQRGDPRAENILQNIVALTDEELPKGTTNSPMESAMDMASMNSQKPNVTL